MGYKKNNFTIQEVKKFWDSVADIYESTNANVQGVHDQRYRVAVDLIAPQHGLRVLNLWSRAGRSLVHLRPAFGDSEIVNLEASDRLRGFAQSIFKDEQFGDTNLVEINYPDNYFDRIVSLETLEHSPDPEALIKSFYRVLKPGGRAVISLPPPSAEVILFIYELFADNHGEGPHRFLSYKEVSFYLADAGLKLIEHRATLFVPFSFSLAVRLNQFLERNFRWLCLRNFGVRHFYVVEKLVCEVTRK